MTSSLAYPASLRAKYRSISQFSPGYLHKLSEILKTKSSEGITSADLRVVRIVESNRPKALRTYDQIPMRSIDLLCQIKLIAPYLADKTIAFIGDYDSASLMMALLSRQQSVPSPRRMLLLDFDERLLTRIRKIVKHYDLDEILECELYNVFDPIPPSLIGQFEYFYTNPPYGCRNMGESVRLFVARGCELAQQDQGVGCIIIPDDEDRLWTRSAMLATQRFLTTYGWTVEEKINYMHQYHLDDDRELASSLMLVRRGIYSTGMPVMPYIGRQVDFDEIPNFYGHKVFPPYPRYIRKNGTCDYSWTK